jgi:transcriptional regulator with XRE-family HTH domain
VIKKQLGKRIAFLRKQLGLTQEKFAEKCDYSIEFISLIERGINAPSIGKLSKIARVLGVEVKDLFDFKADDK